MIILLCKRKTFVDLITSQTQIYCLENKFKTENTNLLFDTQIYCLIHKFEIDRN